MQLILLQQKKYILLLDVAKTFWVSFKLHYHPKHFKHTPYVY